MKAVELRRTADRIFCTANREHVRFQAAEVKSPKGECHFIDRVLLRRRTDRLAWHSQRARWVVESVMVFLRRRPMRVGEVGLRAVMPMVACADI